MKKETLELIEALEQRVAELEKQVLLMQMPGAAPPWPFVLPQPECEVGMPS